MGERSERFWKVYQKHRKAVQEYKAKPENVKATRQDRYFSLGLLLVGVPLTFPLVILAKAQHVPRPVFALVVPAIILVASILAAIYLERLFSGKQTPPSH